MKHNTKQGFAMFASVVCFAVSVLSAPVDFTSRRAVEASARFKLAIEKARKRYLAELRAALIVATRSADLAEANRIEAAIKQTKTELQEDQHGEGAEDIIVKVKATNIVQDRMSNPCVTSVSLRKGERFVLFPNEEDTWCGGGSKRGQRCNYMGYPDSKATKWMMLHYQVGDGPLVPVAAGKRCRAESNGPLKLCVPGGRGGTGEIRVRIVVQED